MDFLVELGGKIRYRRQQLNISQQELAEAVGYTSKGMISNIEAGRVNIPMDKLVMIAHCLAVKPSYLLSDEQAPDMKLYEKISDLSDEEQKQVLAYISIIRRANTWQQQNGTVNDGDSESQRTV
ncbi:MAG: helix-turn-helix transcriptional regulator [Clostridiales bacterium]|nr:helix-turn-helix transcriptional regulator [Clostridiales bacterium]